MAEPRYCRVMPTDEPPCGDLRTEDMGEVLVDLDQEGHVFGIETLNGDITEENWLDVIRMMKWNHD